MDRWINRSMEVWIVGSVVRWFDESLPLDRLDRWIAGSMDPVSSLYFQCPYDPRPWYETNSKLIERFPFAGKNWWEISTKWYRTNFQQTKWGEMSVYHLTSFENLPVDSDFPPERLCISSRSMGMVWKSKWYIDFPIIPVTRFECPMPNVRRLI